MGLYHWRWNCDWCSAEVKISPVKKQDLTSALHSPDGSKAKSTDAKGNSGDGDEKLGVNFLLCR